ncbi:hypothetical protein AgCh_011373 [Apium graveolens]
MIGASAEDTSLTNLKEKRFLYDIVTNGRNGLDVDKFDYIVRDSQACRLKCSFEFDRLLDTMRVIGDEICYHEKEKPTMPRLFSSHADLHRTVYTHAKVKAIELMFCDALVKANNKLRISSRIDDPAEYWKLDDSIMKKIETSKSERLKESRDLILRIRRRDLYQFCNEFTVRKDELEYFKDVTAQDIICSESQGGDHSFDEEDIVVCNIKMDMTRGRTNPLESINIFKDYKGHIKSPIPDESLLPECCKGKIVRVYSKKPKLVELVAEALENFQLKTYGKSTCSTQNKRPRPWDWYYHDGCGVYGIDKVTRDYNGSVIASGTKLEEIAEAIGVEENLSWIAEEANGGPRI